jgi:hypothetical protein
VRCRPTTQAGAREAGLTAVFGTLAPMATMTCNAARDAFEEAVASAMTPSGLEQYRLDRLVELRAVIESLRAERGRELLRDAWAEQSLRHS